jgi:hypothetical protein
MAKNTYTATVKLTNGNRERVSVQADNDGNAKAMLEAQYGRGNVSNVQRA